MSFRSELPHDRRVEPGPVGAVSIRSKDTAPTRPFDGIEAASSFSGRVAGRVFSCNASVTTNVGIWPHFFWPHRLLDFLTDSNRNRNISMRLGNRRIRSAGKASGSIEVTLPPELSPLESIGCQVIVRDGARPEIVLQPELTPAALIFGRIWSRLHQLLQLAGEIGDFPASEVDAVLLPSSEMQSNSSGRPTLVYAYALSVGRAVVPTWPVTNPEFTIRLSPFERSAELDRMIVGAVRPLAVVAGRRLGLSGVVASVWAQALVMLMVYDSGNVLDPGEITAGGADVQHELTSTRQIWEEVCGRNASPLCVFGPQTQDPLTQVVLQRMMSRFRAWQERPEKHRSARSEWQTPAWFQGAP